MPEIHQQATAQEQGSLPNVQAMRYAWLCKQCFGGVCMEAWSALVLSPGECLEAVSGELTFFTLPNCFELFGFDLLLDQDWRMWLLEVGTPERESAD